MKNKILAAALTLTTLMGSEVSQAGPCTSAQKNALQTAITSKNMNNFNWLAAILPSAQNGGYVDVRKDNFNDWIKAGAPEFKIESCKDTTGPSWEGLESCLCAMPSSYFSSKVNAFVASIFEGKVGIFDTLKS